MEDNSYVLVVMVAVVVAAEVGVLVGMAAVQLVFKLILLHSKTEGGVFAATVREEFRAVKLRVLISVLVLILLRGASYLK